MVRIGFIGTGGNAGAHFKGIGTFEDAKIVAVCDVVQERAAQAAVTVGGATAYTDYKQMLKEAKLDAVYLSLPPFAHGDIDRAVVEAKIPVYVEKPVALTRELAEEMNERVARAGLITAVGFQLRYWNVVQAAREALAGQTIGMVTGYRWGGSPPPGAWWRQQDKSGGMMVEQACHNLDLMRYLAGDVKEVFARSGRLLKTDEPDFTIDDVNALTLVFASGAVGSFTNTPAAMPKGRAASIDIFAKSVNVSWKGNRTLISDAEGNQREVTASVPDPMVLGDRAFIDAVKSNDQSKVLSPYSDALKTHHILYAALKSAQTGQPVTL